MILTHQMIEAGRSERGGWRAIQLECLGVAWPPVKGWKRRLIGTQIDPTRYAAFLRHAKPRDNQQQLLLDKLLSKDFSIQTWDQSPEKFANDLYEKCGRDLS